MTKINSVDIVQNKISFRAKTNEKPIISNDNEQSDDKKISASAQLMIGATALASIISLGVAGYNGHLGKGVQKLLGGANKAAGKENKNIHLHNNSTPNKQPEPKIINNPDENVLNHLNSNNTSSKTETTFGEKITHSEITDETTSQMTNLAISDKNAERIEKPSVQTAEPSSPSPAEIEKQGKEYFENEELELSRKKLDIERSNAQNEQWLQEQHKIKEKEYSEFWNKDVIKKDNITPEQFIQKIKDIKNGETLMFADKYGAIESYSGIEDGGILFERSNLKGKIVEQYKMQFINKDTNIVKFITNNSQGQDNTDIYRFSNRKGRGFINVSQTEKRAISEYADRARLGLNDKTFSRCQQILADYGFVPTNKTVKIGDETVVIVMEGLEYDLTADGKLLKKLFARNRQFSYEDVTEIYINKANEIARQKELQRQQGIQNYANNRRRCVYA